MDLNSPDRSSSPSGPGGDDSEDEIDAFRICTNKRKAKPATVQAKSKPPKLPRISQDFSPIERSKQLGDGMFFAWYPVFCY
jgi:hypothetical protein